MTTVADGLLAELSAAETALVPKVEGYRDYLGTNIDAGRGPVSQALNDGEVRLRLIQRLSVAVKELLQDGYPEVKHYQLTVGQFQDLRSNADTILSALESFTSMEPATQAAIAFGAPKEKL